MHASLVVLGSSLQRPLHHSLTHLCHAPNPAVLGTCRFSYHPFLCPVSATDEVHAGVRDDIWGFFTTAAALLTPVSPFQRVYDRFR